MTVSEISSIHGYSDSRLASFSPAVLQEMNLVADRDLIKRSMPGSIIILLAFLVVGEITGLSTDAPISYGFSLALLTIGVVSRFFGIYTLGKQTPERIRQWEHLFSVFVMLTPIAWAYFISVTLKQYGITIELMVILVMTAGIAGGAAVALFIWKRLAQIYLVFLLLLPMFSVMVDGDGSGTSYALIFSLAIYFLFLYFQVERSNSEYWTALFNTQQLKQQTAELSLAKQNAEQANEAKSSFLANMSHELRTPMNAILGFTQIMEDDESLSMAHRKNLKEINQAGKHLLELINEILDLSKIEGGHLRLEQQRFDLFAALDDMATILAPTAYSKGIGFELYIDPLMPRYVVGDELRIRQVLTNLLGNAIKFTEQGEVTVEVRQHADGECAFVVQDSGVGIKPEVIRSLFRPFTQADVSTTRKYGGTGLGLAISRRLVKEMGGDIGVESEPERGSCFWFRLPLPAEDAQEPRIDLTGKRILYPGNDRNSVLVRYLRAWGAELDDHAAAGGECYDLAVFDERLSGGAVDELLPQIQAKSLLRLGVRPIQEVLPGKVAGMHYMQLPIKLTRLLDSIDELFLPRSTQTEVVVKLPQQTASVLHRGKVLLVEDNRVNQLVAINMLKKLGLHVTTVNNGVEALQQMVGMDYDLVFMDVQMPEMDGYEATRTIRQNERGTGRHTTIIAMTANVMSGDRENCLAVGMDDYVSKPINIDELARTVTRWLND